MRACRENMWMLDETPTSKNGRVIALNLGADYCAEHEWGIKRLKEDFGIVDDISKYGMEKRRIQEIPDTLHYLVEGETSILTIKEFWDKKPEVLTVKALKSQELYDRNPLNTAWDERSFGVLVKGKEGQKHLERLNEAFLEKDIAIWLGGGGVFQNAGLCLGIISHMPAAMLNAIKAKDEDTHKLALASEATGIKQKIDALNHQSKEKSGRGILDAPCGYFALSPAWLEGRNKDTRYNVMYFLNPMRQQENNFGWFTVEELEQWMEGKGPIPGKKKAS
jgi:hypothetical protein